MRLTPTVALRCGGVEFTAGPFVLLGLVLAGCGGGSARPQPMSNSAPKLGPQAAEARKCAANWNRAADYTVRQEVGLATDDGIRIYWLENGCAMIVRTGQAYSVFTNFFDGNGWYFNSQVTQIVMSNGGPAAAYPVNGSLDTATGAVTLTAAAGETTSSSPSSTPHYVCASIPTSALAAQPGSWIVLKGPQAKLSEADIAVYCADHPHSTVEVGLH